MGLISEGIISSFSGTSIRFGRGGAGGVWTGSGVRVGVWLGVGLRLSGGLFLLVGLMSLSIASVPVPKESIPTLFWVLVDPSGFLSGL